MPVLHLPSQGTLQYQENVSFENQVATWLLKHGWEVYYPMCDHGHQTDLLVSNGLSFFRLQVKTLKKPGFEQVVVNKWANSRVDYVIYFIHNQSVGCIARAFSEAQIPLYRTSHVRFRTAEESFCRAFALI